HGGKQVFGPDDDPRLIAKLAFLYVIETRTQRCDDFRYEAHDDPLMCCSGRANGDVLRNSGDWPRIGSSRSARFGSCRSARSNSRPLIVPSRWMRSWRSMIAWISCS